MKEIQRSLFDERTKKQNRKCLLLIQISLSLDFANKEKKKNFALF